MTRLDISTSQPADELRSIAERGAGELDGASAQELLQWTEDTFGSDYIVASNMQDGVLVHLAAQVHPGVDVLFLDTGYHFAETIGTRDAVEQVYGVNVINARALASVAEQDVDRGQGPVRPRSQPLLRIAQGRTAEAGHCPATARG